MAERFANGTRLGSFTLLRPLARGATGTVYVARRDGDDVDVALKVLTDLSSVDRARAEREVSIASSLRHPRVVSLLAHESVGRDAIVVAFELLRGETWAARIARGPLAWREAVEVSLQVLEGLSAAHEAGVVHRDVKPANVFLCAGDAVDARLIDFGLARSLAGRRVTATGRLVGTPAYIPPEVLRGETSADARADLWAVAVSLFEALTGELPFEGSSSFTSMFQAAFCQARRLDAVWPSAPPALTAVLARALSRTSAARFSSAHALRDALVAAARATAPAPPRETASGVENRLVVLAVARVYGDARLLRRILEASGARASTLDDGVAALFGHARWTGDEPQRAADLARTLTRLGGAVSVVTEHAELSSDEVPASLLARAAEGLPARGVVFDEATSTLLRRAEAPRAHGPDAADARSAFVGRALERELLLDAVARARLGATPAGVLVTGARGSGRTRLLDEAVAALAHTSPDALTLRARCEPTRREAPFAALHDALGDHLSPALSTLFESASRGDAQAAFDGVRADLESLLSRLVDAVPVVLAFDDAQWLDHATRRVLRSILEASALPLCVWCFADPSAGEGLQGLVPGTQSRALLPLTDAESLRMVSSLRPISPTHAEAIVARAGGNPLVLDALARLPESASLPLDVESAVRAGLDRLDEPARDFVRLAAVFGRAAPLDGVRALGGADCTLDLRRAGWITLRARSRYAGTAEVEFRTGVVPDVARGVWPEARRRALHADAARWLANRDDALAEEVAAQWDLAGQPATAAAAWADATAHASRRGALDAAASHCLRVLARTEVPTLRWRALAARDDALQMNGDRALQREGLDAMGPLAEMLGDGARAELAWRVIHHARMVGDDARADAARALLDALEGREEVTRWSCAAATELALLHAERGRLAEGRACAERAVAMAPRGGEWPRARADHALAYVMVEEGARLDEAMARYADAARGYERAGDLRREAITHVNRGATLAMLGRLGEALDSLDLALERARAVGNQRAVAVALENRGAVRRMLGDYEPARDDLRDALARAHTLGHRQLVAVASIERVYLALAARDREALADAAHGLRSALDGDASSGVAVSARAALLRTETERRDGDAAEARALAEEGGRTASARAELRVALWAVDGERDDDVAALAHALDEVSRDACDDDDGAVRRGAMLRRFEAPTALYARVGLRAPPRR